MQVAAHLFEHPAARFHLARLQHGEPGRVAGVFLAPRVLERQRNKGDQDEEGGSVHGAGFGCSMLDSGVGVQVSEFRLISDTKALTIILPPLVSKSHGSTREFRRFHGF
ncbi:MAG: hypothetical protein ACO3JG_01275 [Luteolibacter sp.]